VAAIFTLSCGCTRSQLKPEAKETPSQPSVIKVEVNPGGPLLLTTTSAMFEVAPTGYIQSYLLREGKHWTLDEPKAGAPNESDYLVQGGKEIHFVLDFDQAKVLESIGKLGRGKHIEVPARPLGPGDVNIQRTLTLEAYDDFPNLLLSTVEYKNTGNSDFTIDRVVEQRHRFTASLADPKAQPWDMWSFQGSSYDWGKDDVFKMTRTSAQPNLFGEAVKGGYGGGISVSPGRRTSERRLDTWKRFRSLCRCR
jgi:hypothetical protein